MPLVIAVLVIIWIFVVISDKGKQNIRAIADQSFECRKTNARFERAFMTDYLLSGLSFNDAFEKTQESIISAGFVPCIPRTAYKNDKSHFVGELGCCTTNSWFGRKNIANVSTSYVYRIDQYDSKAVQVRRELYEAKWNKTHPNEIMPEITDQELYAGFPVNTTQVSNENCRKYEWRIASNIGDYLTHGRFGTCEIVGYEEPPMGKSLMYKAKILDTGEVVIIPYDDKTITKIKNTI